MPVPHARAAVWSLLVVMAAITGPRDPRGVRHPLVAVPGVAVVATLGRGGQLSGSRDQSRPACPSN
jgi:hypothetical protein